MDLRQGGDRFLGPPSLLPTVIGMGQVTNGLILFSEVGVISTAPRGCWGM